MKNNFLSRWSQRKLDADKDVTSAQTDLDEQSADALITTDKQVATDGSEIDSVIDSSTAPTGFQDESDPEYGQPMVDNTDGLVTENQESCDTSDESEEDDVPVESLTMSELMTKTGIDKAAKKAALRKMFLSPEFNVVDRLNDYDHDYAAVKPLAAGVAETLREWVNKVDELDSDTASAESVGDSQDGDVLALDDERANDDKPASGDEILETEQNNDVEDELQQTGSEYATDVDTSSSVSNIDAENNVDAKNNVEARQGDGEAKS